VSKSHQVAFLFTARLDIAYIAKFGEKLLRVAILSADNGNGKTNQNMKFDSNTKIGPYSNIQLTFSGLERLEEGQKGIERFFSGSTMNASSAFLPLKSMSTSKRSADDVPIEARATVKKERMNELEEPKKIAVEMDIPIPPPSPTFTCSRCAKKGISVSKKSEHDDYHFARDMYDEDKKVEKKGQDKKPKNKRSGSSAQSGGASGSGSGGKKTQGTLNGFFSKRA
jgi:DNA polymerase eta